MYCNFLYSGSRMLILRFLIMVVFFFKHRLIILMINLKVTEMNNQVETLQDSIGKKFIILNYIHW